MSAMQRKQKQVLGLATSYPLSSSDSFAVSSPSYSNNIRDDVPSPYSAGSSLQRTPTMPLRQRSILTDTLEDEYYPPSPRQVDSIRALSTSTKASKASKISKIAATASSAGSLAEPISPTYPYDDYAQDDDETDDSEITDSEEDEDDEEEEDDWLDEIERPPGAPPKRRNTRMSSIVPTPTSAKSNHTDQFTPSGLARSNTTASHTVSSKAQRMLGLDGQATMTADDYRRAVQKGQGHASREVASKAQRMLGLDQPGAKRTPGSKKRPVVKAAARLLETYGPSRTMSSRIPSRANTFESEDTRELLPIDESNVHPAFRKNGAYAESASSAEYPSLSRSSFQDSLSSREVLSPDEEVRARVFNPMAWEKMNSVNSNYTTRNPAAVLTAPFVDQPLYALYGDDNQPIFELGDSAPAPVELPAEFLLPQELPAELTMNGSHQDDEVDEKEEQEPILEAEPESQASPQESVPEPTEPTTEKPSKSKNLANLSVEITSQNHNDSLPPVTSTSIYNTTKSPSNLLTPPPPKAMVIPSPLAMALESGSPIGPLPAPWTIQQLYRPLRRPSTSDSSSESESESESEDDKHDKLHVQPNGLRPDSETFTPPKPKKKYLAAIPKAKATPPPFYDDGTSPDSESHEDTFKSRPRPDDAKSPSRLNTNTSTDRLSLDSNPAPSPLTMLLSDLQAQASLQPSSNGHEEEEQDEEEYTGPPPTTYVPRPRQFSEPAIATRKLRNKRTKDRKVTGAKSVGLTANRPFSFEHVVTEKDVGLVPDVDGNGVAKQSEAMDGEGTRNSNDGKAFEGCC